MMRLSDAGHFQPYALLPVLVTLSAFILSFLLVFAGRTPGFMEEYAVFTLNTSRIGENLIQSFDSKISSLNFSSIVDVGDLTKRAVPATYLEASPVAPAPEATITVATGVVERGLGDDIKSGFSQAVSAVGAKATAVETAVQAKATAVEGAVTSKIDAALAAAEKAIIEAVNDAYGDLIRALSLKDFYSIHMTTTCHGEYAYANGTNVTVGAVVPPPSNSSELHPLVDECKKQSALDPVSIVRVLYEIGIALTGIALVFGVWGAARFSRKLALLNIIGSMPALLFIGLASAAVHGVAVGAAGLINFVGQEIGVAGYVGYKYIAMSWATTGLLLVNMGLWVALMFVGEKLHLPQRDGARHASKSGSPAGQQTEMKTYENASWEGLGVAR